MALQKNIKEVETTEAGFVANAAAKNDGFLTDVTGYPMIKMRGNDYDYWFPEKSRDELGAYTYYDKTVKDLTVLNDCIVQRRLSSYGDADTYLDLSTDDQAVLNVGGVPFLTVAESESAAIGTLGGNLALGANTISGDGAPNKGIGVEATGIPTVTATATPNGDVRYALVIRDDTSYDIGNGGGIAFYGKTNATGSYGLFGGIKASKENATEGNNASSIYIQSRANGQAPANALRLDSDQNGYITNKLMVGSLTETPQNQLSVYKDANESVFLSVGNSKTGQNGVRIGFDDEQSGKAVYDISYGTFTHMFRYETSFGTGVYAPLMSLYYDSRPGYNNIARVYGDLQVDEQINVGGDAQIDGNLHVDGDITLLGNFDADDKISASAINAKYVDSATHRLDIKSSYSNIARFSSYDALNTLTVYGDLVVDSNLNVGGLTASQIVETDANKKLISVAKGTAYNANFGTGSNDVCRGDDSRLSDARTPINNDYYVQGSSSTRTTDAGDTDVDSYSKSGFYGAASTALNLPTATGYGIIHTNHTTDQRAFQLASRWSSNRLYYRVENDGTWEPWVELYHTGNFDPSTKQPADATLTALAGLNTTKGFLYQTGTDAFTKYPFGTTANTVCEGDDSRLSDARTPTAHASTHLYNGGDAIAGEASFGLRSVSISDAWSVGGGLERGGIGIISNSGTHRQAITFTDAVADSNPVFSIITSKNNGSTWSNVFNVTSSGSGIFKGDITSSQNGYIKNKLMVGSLTETPTVKLAVYDDGSEGCLMSISDNQSGPNAGLVLGIAEYVQGPEITLSNQCIIRADGYSRNLYFQGETTVPNVFSNYIACEFGRTSGTRDVKTVTIADKLVVDGDAQIDGDIYTTPLTDISSSCEVVGWGTLTTKSIYYRKIGKQATVYFHIKGTADPVVNTAYIYNIPVPISSTITRVYNNCFGKDSTGVLTNGVIAMVESHSSLSSSIEFMQSYKGIPLWPTSGAKEVYGSITFLAEE